jgi:hypothetical protein
MVDQFKVFADAVREQFNRMAQGALFIVDSDRDLIWQTYLEAFPAGSNPMFRERTEHDCSCCRQFIRSIGNVVSIRGGELISVWNLEGLPAHYQAVADAMAAYIQSLPIRDVFLTDQKRHGSAVTHEQVKDSGAVRAWNHFAVEVPSKFIEADYEAAQGKRRETHAMILRALGEIKVEAVATVLDLIDSNTIYRGAEFRKAVDQFAELQLHLLQFVRDDGLDSLRREAWTLVDHPAARFRNTLIGNLVDNLSKGVELEDAVRMYESQAAPQNYKRPTALITKGMVENAMKTIHDLDLEPALERRHARLSDVSVDSVLFVDRSVRKNLKGGVKDLLMEEIKPAAFDEKRAETISIDEFVRNVLPKSTAVDLWLDNSLMQNFVSLTAPVHADSKRLFKWPNDFAWSYDGNLTDSSIKQRVKSAGGRVEDVFMRVSLAWSNYDDLDLHCIDPGGRRIYYGNKAGVLDVDMNAGGGSPSRGTRTPVENMRWVRREDVRDGDYKVYVNNYRRVESIDVGFEIEIEYAGGLYSLKCDKSPGNCAIQEVGVLTVKNGVVEGFAPAKGMTMGARSQEKWGLNTLQLARVDAIVLSPNYWGESAVGNKHWFFILNGCKNPLPCRGIYNEFLHPRLDAHRRVFEVLGEKTKCPVADEQLSGVGFSSTRASRVSVVAMGPKLSKSYSIVFGGSDGNVREGVADEAALQLVGRPAVG